MRVVDTGTIFCGQGLLAPHTVHLINQGIGKAELRTRVNQMRDNIYGVPDDEFEQLPGLQRLGKACDENNVTLLCCRGGITTGI